MQCVPVPVFLCAEAYSNSTFYRKYAGGALYRLVLSLVMFRRRSWMVSLSEDLEQHRPL